MNTIIKWGFKALIVSILLTLSTTMIACEIEKNLTIQDSTSIHNRRDTVTSTIPVSLEVDLVSQYIWRGQDLGNVSLQPTLGIEYKGLSLSTWGSVGISNWADTKELDFTLDYTFKGFSIGITDYWFSTGNYFQYKNNKTTHIWEGYVCYDFNFLAVKWFTNFAGNDGLNADGTRAFSSYLELTAPFRLATLNWEASLGLVPWRTTLYVNKHFAATNVSLRATKDFTIKDKYHLPIYAGLIANPNSKKLYLLFGLSFKI